MRDPTEPIDWLAVVKDFAIAATVTFVAFQIWRLVFFS